MSDSNINLNIFVDFQSIMFISNAYVGQVKKHVQLFRVNISKKWTCFITPEVFIIYEILFQLNQNSKLCKY